MKHPYIKEIEKVDLLQHEKIILSNGLELYLIPAGKQALVKVDVIFDAGSANSLDPVLPSAVNALLNDGTTKHNSFQIADIIDGKGAFYMPDIQKDYAQTSMYLLNKFAKDLMPLYTEMINNSVFPEEEIDNYRRSMKQRFLVENEKVNVQSYQAFINSLFGKNSNYADNTKAEDFDGISRDNVLEFYNGGIRNKAKFIIASGMIDDEIKNEIITQFEKIKIDDESITNDFLIYGDVGSKDDWIKTGSKNKQQVSMRIGRPTVGSDHEDYWGLSLLNTILGGYFGSRLNKVIREEKGLTYGVHSHITKLKRATFLSIHAELNAENWEEAYASIIEVFDGLKKEAVSNDELEMVRRYIKGSLLQSLDGAFENSSYLKNSLVYGLNAKRVNQYINYLDQIKPQDLIRIAEQYLQEKDFYKIVAGV